MVNRRKRGSDGKFFTYTGDLKKHEVLPVGISLDSTLNFKEEKRFRKKYFRISKQLSKDLPLTLEEVESLMLMYYKFLKYNDKMQSQMTRSQFKDVLHCCFDITSSELLDTIVGVLDKSPSHCISMENFVKAMSLFLRGSLDDKICYCFNVYDPFNTGKITRDRMLILMSSSVIGEEDTDDVVKDLVDDLFKKLDVDRDGKLTYDDFVTAVYKHPLMLECLGQCLPTRLGITAFLASFTRYIGKL